uniref:Uncharacterized protein n=1 Tax=Anopheles minimus TaxID=112268 RepID=A0A182VQQ0_9DIPT
MSPHTGRFALVLVCVVGVIGSSAALNLQDACETPDGNPGTCVLIRSCLPIRKLLLMKEKITPADREFVKNSNCGQQGRSVLVCCPLVRKLTDRFDAPVELPPTSVCGRMLMDRIVGGEATALDAYPWLARLQYQVRLGEYDTTTDIDCINDDCADPVRDVLISAYVVHPEYFKQNGADYNDIALLQLSETIEFTDFIRPICLPVAPEIRAANLTNVRGTVAGWGQTENSSSSTKKLQLRVPLVAVPVIIVIMCVLHSGVAQYQTQCRTPDQKGGVCVTVAQCPLIVRLLNQPLLTSNIVRFLEASRCGILDKKVLVCCETPQNTVPSTIVPPVQTQPPASEPVANRLSYDEQLQLLPAECGIQYTDRIIGGEQARIDEYPWTVLIQHRRRTLQSRYKLFVGVSGVPEQQCRRQYPDANIDQTQVCAGGAANKDSCRGDSGGPLMYVGQRNSEGVLYLGGLVSFGRQCGVQGVPGVYTRVNQYIEWIVSNLEP